MYKRIYRQNGRMNHHQTSPNNKTYYETGPFHNFIRIYSLIKKLCLKLLNFNNVYFQISCYLAWLWSTLLDVICNAMWLWRHRYFMTSSVTSLAWWRHKIYMSSPRLQNDDVTKWRHVFMTSRREDPNHSNETVNKRIQFVCLFVWIGFR